MSNYTPEEIKTFNERIAAEIEGMERKPNHFAIGPKGEDLISIGGFPSKWSAKLRLSGMWDKRRMLDHEVKEWFIPPRYNESLPDLLRAATKVMDFNIAQRDGKYSIKPITRVTDWAFGQFMKEHYSEYFPTIEDALYAALVAYLEISHSAKNAQTEN